MTAPQFLPDLPGLGWSVKKTPIFATRVSQHVSGREVRSASYAHALYQFEITFEALSSGRRRTALQDLSLQQLMGFYNSCRGQFGTFLYEDPTDCVAGNAVIGTGDGTTTTFTAQRSLGGLYEPVSYVTSLGSVTVDGVPAAGASLSLPNTVLIVPAPPSGTVVAASFRYAYLCRFIDDQVDFENFMQDLWTVGSLKFRSVRSAVSPVYTVGDIVTVDGEQGSSPASFGAAYTAWVATLPVYSGTGPAPVPPGQYYSNGGWPTKA